MKAIAAALVIGWLSPSADHASYQNREESVEPRQSQVDVRSLGMSTTNRPAENAKALMRIFADRGGRRFFIPKGVYQIACGTYFVAQSAISIVGEGAGKSVLKLAGPCQINNSLMSWTSKSDVTLSDWTLDLANSRYVGRQEVLFFAAYAGNAANLTIRRLSIINGNTNSLQIAVAASGGFQYSGVVVEGNELQMTPGRSQNQCIALTTVNGTGAIPSARVFGNRCVGSGIQADGDRTIVSANDIRGYQFGSGIFLAFHSPLKVRGAKWEGGLATVIHDRASNAFVRGQRINIIGASPSGYNGRFILTAVNPTTLTFALPVSPGAYQHGGLAAADPSVGCLIKNNLMQDTPQTLDINRSAPGGIENNCVDSLVSDNISRNLGGPGYINFASGARYVGNSAINVGYLGSGSALAEGDGAAFVVFDNGFGLPWYASSALKFEGNTSYDGGSGRTKFGYYEEPYHHFDVSIGPNDFHGARQNVVIRKRPPR